MPCCLPSQTVWACYILPVSSSTCAIVEWVERRKLVDFPLSYNHSMTGRITSSQKICNSRYISKQNPIQDVCNTKTWLYLKRNYILLWCWPVTSMHNSSTLLVRQPLGRRGILRRWWGGDNPTPQLCNWRLADTSDVSRPTQHRPNGALGPWR